METLCLSYLHEVNQFPLLNTVVTTQMWIIWPSWEQDICPNEPNVM